LNLLEANVQLLGDRSDRVDDTSGLVLEEVGGETLEVGDEIFHQGD